MLDSDVHAFEVVEVQGGTDIGNHTLNGGCRSFGQLIIGSCNRHDCRAPSSPSRVPEPEAGLR